MEYFLTSVMLRLIVEIGLIYELLIYSSCLSKLMLQQVCLDYDNFEVL